MTRALALAFAAVLGAAAPAAAQDGALAKAASDFYTVVLSLKQGGIPDAKARAQLAPFLSADLDDQLVQAAKAETRYAAGLGEPAPPLLEGDIFSSLFEGATAFALDGCEVQGDKAECTMALTNVSGDEKPTHWTDTLVLVHGANGWRVDDVAYGGNWPFANKGTLKGNLAFAIENAGGDSQ